MDILYINHYAGSKERGMEYRPYYLAREWVKLGHRVIIIAASFSHLRQVNPIIPAGQYLNHEIIDGIHYMYLATPSYSGNGIKRFINIFAFLQLLLTKRKHIIYEMRRILCDSTKCLTNTDFKPALVISSSTYPMDGFIAKRFAKTYNATWVHEVHDLWPLTLIELHGISRLNPLIWLMEFAQNYAYTHAHKVVSLLGGAKEYLQKHGMHPSKFVYIPNGVDLHNLSLNNISNKDVYSHDTIGELKRANKFLIGYAGSMGAANALTDLLQVAHKLQVVHKLSKANDQEDVNQLLATKIVFVLIGDGALKSKLVNDARRLQLSNIIFLPTIAKSAIPGFLSLMDAMYLGWRNLPIYHYGVSPNKLFDYMLAAKPILHAVATAKNTRWNSSTCDDAKRQHDLVACANCGISVNAGNITAIKNACLKLAGMSRGQLQLLGDNGRDYVIMHHNYAMLAKRFLNDIQMPYSMTGF